MSALITFAAGILVGFGIGFLKGMQVAVLIVAERLHARLGTHGRGDG